MNITYAKTGYPTEYDWNSAVQSAEILSKELRSRGEKLCLFIGRMPGEPIPGFGLKKPDDETWVSLDLGKNYDSTGFLAGKQLHFQMDMNDDERIKRIHKLFDKVIVDWSTLQFNHKRDEVWYSLGKLLRPQKESQLITFTNNFGLFPYHQVSKVMKMLPFLDQPKNDEAWNANVDLYSNNKLSFAELLQRWPAEEKPTWKNFHELNDTELWTKGRVQWMTDRENGLLNRFKSDGFFANAVMETNALYPYREHRSDAKPHHFILSGPQPALYGQ